MGTFPETQCSNIHSAQYVLYTLHEPSRRAVVSVLAKAKAKTFFPGRVHIPVVAVRVCCAHTHRVT